MIAASSRVRRSVSEIDLSREKGSEENYVCHGHQVSKWCTIVTQHHVCREMLKVGKLCIEMLFLIISLYTIYENVDHTLNLINNYLPS